MKDIKKFIKMAAVGLCIAVAAAACSRHRIIPDKTLAMIFHDAFLTNAYLETKRFNTDSLDIYGPVFEKYGYTVQDVQYTIGNFSKRKSKHLGDVVEETIKILEEEGKVYEKEVAVLDTIDNIARRTFRRTVYADSLLHMSRLRDTSLLQITVEGLLPGEYKIDFDYRIDSLDEATGRKALFFFERADGSSYANTQQSLYKNKRTEHISRTLNADTAARRLRLKLYNFSFPKQAKHRDRAGIEITDLKVVFTPEKEAAVDSLFERQMPVRIFFVDLFAAPQGDGTTDESEQ